MLDVLFPMESFKWKIKSHMFLTIVIVYYFKICLLISLVVFKVRIHKDFQAISLLLHYSTYAYNIL